MIIFSTISSKINTLHFKHQFITHFRYKLNILVFRYEKSLQKSYKLNHNSSGIELKQRVDWTIIYWQKVNWLQFLWLIHLFNSDIIEKMTNTDWCYLLGYKDFYGFLSHMINNWISVEFAQTKTFEDFPVFLSHHSLLFFDLYTVSVLSQKW